MITNEILQKDVQDAIKWQPLLHAAEVGVIVKNGVVTLTGIVDSYSKKLEAEDAAKNVAGVKAVVEKIIIHFGDMKKKDDSEIANEILTTLKWNFSVPKDKIKVKVENGWITLDGEVQWNYQKEAAKNSITHLFGIKGVTNNIVLKSDIMDKIEQVDIEQALKRNWSINENDIKVEVDGNKVTLSGIVHSLSQMADAGRIANNARGVSIVDNNLNIQ